MKTGKKVLLSLVMSAAMTLTAFTNLFPQTVYSANEAVAAFKDVPANSYAYKDINDLRALGITNGIGNNLFGYNQPVTRAEFITFLCRLMKWEYVSPSIGSFSDNMDKSKYYYSPIETALSKGAITTAEKAFRPEEPATREEMAIMLVRCLGYDALAKRLAYLGAPFSDVSQNTGYITIARDFGIISGTGKGFNPEGKAMKEQAAAMMMRMYNRLNTPVSGLNAFYAIKSSGQAAFVQDLDSLCCGWSSLEYDQDAGKVFINTARSINGTLKDFYLPQGFAGVTGTARSKGVPALLMVYGSQLNKIVPAGASSTADSSAATGMMDFLLKDSGRTDELISEIAEAVSNSSRIAADGSASESSSFDGVVVDFEYMKGTELKTAFTAFLQKLRNKLPEGTLLYVTVHPAVSRNRTYFDAYDFKKIGEI
ncbi:MAG: hypothetical protein HGA22_09665, partial [Clostridiales bacterium]|nr:hypothetical protein [Clostridiales bacterium]